MDFLKNVQTTSTYYVTSIFWHKFWTFSTFLKIPNHRIVLTRNTDAKQSAKSEGLFLKKIDWKKIWGMEIFFAKKNTKKIREMNYYPDFVIPNDYALRI